MKNNKTLRKIILFIKAEGIFFLIVPIFIMMIGYLPYLVLDRYWINWDPEIAIDNYSTEYVSIYVDGEFWMEVPPSKNLMENSLGNKLYNLNEGKHFIKIISNENKVKNQKFTIEIKDNHYYVINVFRVVIYEYGTARYSSDIYSSRTRSTKENANSSFIDVGNEKNYRVSMFARPLKKTYKGNRNVEYIIRKDAIRY